MIYPWLIECVLPYSLTGGKGGKRDGCSVRGFLPDRSLITPHNIAGVSDDFYHR